MHARYRYKPMIIANALTGIIVWSVLIWTTTLLGLQIVEVFYGFYQATEVAYYSYIYAKVEKKYYPRVTSHTRAAMFVGKLVAGLSAQLLISFDWMNYMQLMYISVGCKCAFDNYIPIIIPTFATQRKYWPFSGPLDCPELRRVCISIGKPVPVSRQTHLLHLLIILRLRMPRTHLNCQLPKRIVFSPFSCCGRTFTAPTQIQWFYSGAYGMPLVWPAICKSQPTCKSYGNRLKTSPR